MAAEVQRVRIGSVEVDATIRQEHVAQAIVTSHPVELGADPADHVRSNPDTLTMDCVVSGTPLHAAPDIDPADPDALTPRIRRAYADLTRYKTDGELLTVRTSLRVYENMVITDLRVTREARTGVALAFTISLLAVRLVQNLIEVASADPRMKGKAKLGKQGTTPTKVEPPYASTLHRAFLGGRQ
jgi:hypothetical protein